MYAIKDFARLRELRVPRSMLPLGPTHNGLARARHLDEAAGRTVPVEGSGEPHDSTRHMDASDFLNQSTAVCTDRLGQYVKIDIIELE